MLINQNNTCAICKQPEKTITPKTKRIQKLSVDHNHSTGKIRQLLCNRCNNLLGHSQESINILQSCIDYLKKHSV